MNRREQPRNRCRCAHGVHGRTRGQQHLTPLDHVEREYVQRGARVAEVVKLDVPPYQLPETVVGYKVISPTGQPTDEREEADGENILALESTPHARERAARLDLLGTRGDERRVERTGRGRDQQVGVNPPLVERVQHPNLQCAEAAASRENECRERVPVNATAPAEGIER